MKFNIAKIYYIDILVVGACVVTTVEGTSVVGAWVGGAVDGVCVTIFVEGTGVCVLCVWW